MSVKVPFVDLARMHAPLKADILARIGSIIDRSAFVLGPEVEQFEKEFAAFVGSAHAVGVNSGLDALKLALQALGVGPGDEVIVPANTFIATAYAVSHVGATVVLAEIEEDSRNLDPRAFEKAITSRTKAVMPVHLYGQPATMGPLMELARSHKIHVVEDCAQSHGARYKGKTTGTFGAAGCFSFYPGKNLGAMGEGGAIVTEDAGLAAQLRGLRNVGQKEKYVHEWIGHNARLHTVQAAVLSAKLPLLATQNEQRREAAGRYADLLRGTPLKLPATSADRTHVFHLYAVEAPDRDALQKHLTAQGIGTAIHYPIPIHRSPCYAATHSKLSFPVTEKIASRLLSLPMFPGMTEVELASVATAVKSFYK